MNKEEFIKLTIADKTEYLLNYSEIISEKVYYECNISLFLVENFYVEVFKNLYKGYMRCTPSPLSSPLSPSPRCSQAYYYY
jgi:hypothetical protein